MPGVHHLSHVHHLDRRPEHSDGMRCIVIVIVILVLIFG